MMTMFRTGSLAAILLCATGAWSAVVGVQAQLGARQVRVGEQIPLIVTVSVDDDGKDLPWPEVKLPAGVALGSKDRSQSTSEQVSIVNFKMTRQKTTQVQYVLKLSATKSGTYPIGPVSFQGRDLGSGEVKVVDAPQDVRTSTIVGRRSVYVGQQVPFIWRITADRPFEVRKFPDVRTALGNGFYSATPDSQKLQMQPVEENGKRVGRLDMVGSLFPLKAGKQTLPGTSLDYRIVEQSMGMDPFEAMMSGQDPFEAMRGTRRVVDGSARTQEVPLEILPVPDKNRPSAFQGGVGSFKIDAKLEKDSLRAGDGTTLTITMEGDGQPQASGTPVWTAPNGVEAYPPQDDWSKDWKNGTLRTKLVRRVVLVPRQSGKVALDSVRFAWFDPDKKSFHQAAIALPHLKVSPAPATASVSDTSRQGGGASGPVLRPVDKFWIVFGKVSAALWTLLAASGLGWLLFRFLRERMSLPARQRRRLLALRKKLDKLPKPKDDKAAAGQIRQILTDALAIRLGDDSRAWTSQEMQEKAPAHLGWNEDESVALGALLMALQATEFAGYPFDPQSRKQCEGILQALLPKEDRTAR
jgi:hypothetical protein